jgi:hypothetical protein
LECEQFIENCSQCTKEGICLKCNNKAISGFSNCTICENTIDWKYIEGQCKLLTDCPKYFFRDKNNNNKINCIKDISECPEKMIYLNLDTGECLETVSGKDLVEYKFQIKGGEEELRNASDKIFNEANYEDFLKYYLIRNSIKINSTYDKLIIGLEDKLKNPDNSNIGVYFGDCPEKIRLEYKINDLDGIVYKVYDITFNGTKILKYEAYNKEDLKNPLDLSACENRIMTITLINHFENYEEFQEWLQIIVISSL